MYSDFSKIEAEMLESKTIKISRKKEILTRKINSTRINPSIKIEGVNRKRASKFIRFCDNGFTNTKIPFELWKDMVVQQRKNGKVLADSI